MTVLGDDLDGWDEMTEDEQEAIRALLLDLGLAPTDDPDTLE